MQARELFSQTWRSLAANKLRSFLTMFGIAWGIVSIILMMAAVEGLRVGQRRAAETLGKDIMIVFGGVTSQQAGGERAGRRVWLNASDADLLREQCPSLSLVTPEQGLSNVLIRSPFNSGRFRVTGGLPFFAEIRSLGLAEGRLWNDGDEKEARRVAVVGYEVKSQLFYSRNPVGATIYLNGLPYEVVGYLAKKDQDSNYDGPDNSKVFVPFASAIRDFPSPPPATPTTVNRLIATPRNVELHQQADGEIRRALARRYNFDPRDRDAVFIWDTVKGAKMFASMTKAMAMFLGVVGVVTLILGGIGVMNVMLVSVTERTREIGVRMAVGASRHAILQQFLLEAVTLTAVSGLAGLGFAVAICYGVTSLIPQNSTSYFAGLLFTPQAALIAFGSLGLIAIAAGTYPAKRAAALQPIDALRYEH